MRKLRRWRMLRRLDAHVAKALERSGRLSQHDLLDAVDQAVFSIGQGITVLRTVTDPEYRFQMLAESKANADLAAVFLDEMARRAGEALEKYKLP